MAKIRVLIADDHPTLREGLVVVLQSTGEIEVVGQAGSGHEAIYLAEQLQPDVVVMDVQMTGMDGIQATANIRQRVPTTQVVIFSNFDQDEYIYQSLQAGARGYVLKTSTVEELLDVVRAAARGESLLPPNIATRLVEQISTIDKRPDFTPREEEVLGLLAQGLRNKEIGEQLHITERTVKNHIANIMAKLGVESRTEVILQALKGRLIELD
ncbi:MAG: response regulator transcription factor [Anaerolineae bacterium]|nr:response regulator transcription factor [Anaerolineae bacterium]